MKIVVDVVNSQKVKDLTEEIKRQEQEILKWNKAMQTAGPTQQAVLQANMTKAGQAIASAKAQIASLEPASRNAGRGLSQLSYALDDVQYGFNAIVNNIPQIAMGFGAGAGVAGAVGIAAVAVNQLIKHWGELADIAQSMWVGTSLDQLTKLREKAEEATKAFEKLAETPTKAIAAVGKGLGELITEGPTERMLKATAEAVAKDPMLGVKAKPVGPNPFLGAALGLLAEPLEEAPDKLKSRQKEAQKEADEENTERAKALLGSAASGDLKAIQDLEGLMKRSPGNFSDAFKAEFGRLKEQLKPDFFADPAETERGQKRREETAKVQAEVDRANKEKAEAGAKELKAAGDRDRALEHQKRIQNLEDERTQVQRAQKAFDDKMWQEMHQGKSSQILSGARAATDYYQTGSQGRDHLALAKEAQKQREKTNKLLEGIQAKITAENRAVQLFH